MGCHQSKVEEQVVVNAPVVEPTPIPPAPVSVEVKAVNTDTPPEITEPTDAPTQELAPASTAASEDPTTQQVDDAIEIQPKEDVEVEATEVEVEAAPVADEPVVEETPTIVASTAEEAPTPTPEDAPTPTPEEPTQVEEGSIKSTDEHVSEATEPSPEPLLANAASQMAIEPESEASPEVEAKEEKTAAKPKICFESVGVSVGDGHVVYYQFKFVDTNAPQNQFILRKRFNDFKLLHAEMTKLMASEANVPASQSDKFKTYPALPALPKAGVSTVLFGRRNKALTADRDAQFGRILNAIARHPIAYESNAFQVFIA